MGKADFGLRIGRAEGIAHGTEVKRYVTEFGMRNAEVGNTRLRKVDRNTEGERGRGGEGERGRGGIN